VANGWREELRIVESIGPWIYRAEAGSLACSKPSLRRSRPTQSLKPEIAKVLALTRRIKLRQPSQELDARAAPGFQRLSLRPGIASSVAGPDRPRKGSGAADSAEPST